MQIDHTDPGAVRERSLQNRKRRLAAHRKQAPEKFLKSFFEPLPLYGEGLGRLFTLSGPIQRETGHLIVTSLKI